MIIRDYLGPELISFIEAQTKEEAIGLLVNLAVKAGKASYREAFLSALMAREKLLSTGIGFGIALPHAKTAELPEFFICIGISKNGINWQAFDAKPVHLVFLIGGPEGEQENYLKILATLTSIIKSPDTKDRLFAASSAEEILSILKSV